MTAPQLSAYFEGPGTTEFTEHAEDGGFEDWSFGPTGWWAVYEGLQPRWGG